MAKMVIGHDDDGPFLKITSDAFDPSDESDENYGNFRFNSRHAQMGYFDTIVTDTTPTNVSSTEYDQSIFQAPISLTYYNYPSMCDYYLTNGGWNYPNWWRSINRTSGGGNEWGSVASFDVTPRTTGLVGKYWWVRSTQGFLSGYQCKYIISPLPADNSPLPFAEVTPTTGQRVLSIDESAIKIARRGYDVRTASDSQLIVGGTQNRMPVYMARRTAIFTGQTLTIPLPSWVPSNAVVLMQWNIQGQARRLPSIWVGSTSSGEKFELRWRIDGSTLTIQNLAPYNYDVVFMVVSNTVTDPQGGPAIREGISAGEKYLRIVQADGKVAADSRWSYAPIIKTGFAENFSGSGALFTASTTFPDQGYIPFVWYCFTYRRVRTFASTGNTYVTTNHIGPRWITNRYNQQDYKTNSATISRTSVVFRTYCGSAYDLYFSKNVTGITNVDTPLYFRYYIFAIPDVQSS